MEGWMDVKRRAWQLAEREGREGEGLGAGTPE